MEIGEIQAQHGVSFNANRADYTLIFKIAERWVKQRRLPRRDPREIAMDIAACHCNGCPLRLADLLNAEDGSFDHDMMGIYANLDRRTGRMQGMFLPRYASH